MTAEHLYSVGAKLPWRNGLTVEIVALVPTDSSYTPDPNLVHYVGLFQGRERVMLSQQSLMRRGEAA